jgi:hypothetical protein
MELLNHFVAARLMKDTELFERIGRYDGSQRLLGPISAAPPIDDAEEARSWVQPAARPANDDARLRRSG